MEDFVNGLKRTLRICSFWKKIFHFEGFKLVLNNSFEAFNQKVFHDYINIHNVQDRIVSEADGKIKDIGKNIVATDKETEIVSKYIKFRTALTPYVYSTARQTMKGLPMMRPMFFEDVTTPQEFVENQFYFGDSILVAPIVKEISMEKERNVYLPKGTWYDFESMKEVNSNGETISVKSELETIPVYIKQGAIIPCEKDGTNYLFIIPADSESSFVLYKLR